MHDPEYARTSDIVSKYQLRSILGTEKGEKLEATIPVCAGEWRLEPDAIHYCFYLHPKDA